MIQCYLSKMILICRADGRAEFGSCVSCVGNFITSRGPEQEVEIYCEKIDILGHCKPADYPFLTSTGLSGDWKVMRGFPHLRPRAPPFAALMRLRSDIYQEIHQIMKENEYFHVTTPIMTKNDCEGGCKSFLVKVSFKQSNGVALLTFLSIIEVSR